MECRTGLPQATTEVNNCRAYQLAIPLNIKTKPIQKPVVATRIIQDQEDYLLLKEFIEKLNDDFHHNNSLISDVEKCQLDEAKKLISNFILHDTDMNHLRPYGSFYKTSKLVLGGQEFTCTRLVPASKMGELRELRIEGIKTAIRSCVDMMVSTLPQEVSKDAPGRKRQQMYITDIPDTTKYRNLPMNQKKLFMCRSLIHEWGLFTLQDIPSNDLIIEYTGEKIRSCVADERERKRGLDASSYFFRVNFEYVIDAMHFGNISKYINHSCDPNCYARVVEIDGEPKILIFAARLITAGSELTYDYQFPYEDTKIPCKCGAEKCREFLN